ncbi:unnamed protein product [Caenorhabditis angaria]|uniref:Uncharacterized protein n=1 Tax=Caenorhabditis angaria TaxID=860376 RepID=A0A9P1N5M7_9PELO|nr:unnamed protein product [Caenorhabditis angaria]
MANLRSVSRLLTVPVIFGMCKILKSKCQVPASPESPFFCKPYFSSKDQNLDFTFFFKLAIVAAAAYLLMEVIAFLIAKILRQLGFFRN